MGQNLTGQLISATYEDLVQISGSILTDGTGSNINSLTVTASLATNATNAISASFATSASFAQTASFALNVTPINTGSFVTTASISNADITFTKADASTFGITVNNVQNAFTASIATSASFASTSISASFASTASKVSILDDNGNQSHKVTFVNTSVATGGDQLLIDPTATQFTYNPSTNLLTVTASLATNAVSASHAVNADTASFALNASFGTSATASFTGSTWNFIHNLNKEYVIVDCYDDNEEEIIPQTIDLVSSNQVTISFPVSVQGVAVASLGNGVTNGSVSPITTYSALQNTALTNFTQKLDITAVGTYAMSVSASGMHIVDLTGLSVSSTAAVNITLHPQAFTTVGQQAGILFTYLSGSVAACTYRTLVSASAGFQYFSPNLLIGGTTTTLSRQTNNSRRDFGANVNNPTIMTLTSDGIYLGASALPIPAVNNFLAGSQGTPIP